MEISLYTQTGEQKGKIKVSDKIFNVKTNNELIHRAVVMLHGNRRKSNAHTKNRSEVRGGGAKPWRQKGTGRARHGSIRSPLWKGGGVTFGPRNEKNYKRRMPKKEKRNAFFSVLTAKAKDGQIFALDKYDPPKNKDGKSQIKTKMFFEMIKKLPISKTALFVIPKRDTVFLLSSRNIKGILCLHLDSINILDIIKYDKVVFLEEALRLLEKRYHKWHKEPEKIKDSKQEL